MTPRALLFGPGDTSPTTDLGLLVLRLGAGLSLAFAHGLGKVPPSEGFIEATAGMGFPLPTLFAWAAGLSELAGGLLIAIGLLTRPAAIFVAITMGTAFFVRHGSDPFQDGELSFVYLTVALTLVLTGAGRYAVDRIIHGPPRTTYS